MRSQCYLTGWHQSEVNTPCLYPSQTDRYSIYLLRRDGRLSWLRWSVTYRNGLSAYTDGHHPSINWAAQSRQLNSQPVDLTSDVLTTSKPNPDPPEDQSHQISSQSHLKRRGICTLMLQICVMFFSTFTVRLQQMCLELVSICETFWTVSTQVRLCTSVSINVTLQTMATFIQLPTVTTVIRSSVAVYTTFVLLQVAGLAETFLTQWTLVWFVSRVDSHVSL